MLLYNHDDRLCQRTVQGAYSVVRCFLLAEHEGEYLPYSETYPRRNAKKVCICVPYNDPHCSIHPPGNAKKTCSCVPYNDPHCPIHGSHRY
jgi:hypothetical protein